jgi:hydroxymethylbilane synthase
MTDKIILGTRGSALALAQTRAVAALLESAWPDLVVEQKIISTTGDKRLDLKLSATADDRNANKIDKGLFTKELETALLSGEVDAAIHSLKDLPTALPEGLALVAVPERASVADVFITRDPGIRGIRDLPENALVATSSLRRAWLLQESRPDVRVHEIRGNVTTRLKKLAESDEIHGMILAEAGLRRLGFQLGDGQLTTDDLTLPATILDPLFFLPAVGQGAIGIESREGDDAILSILQACHHWPTGWRVFFERNLLQALGGGCQTPLGVFSWFENEETLNTKAAWKHPETGETRQTSGSAPLETLSSFARILADQLQIPENSSSTAQA